MSPAVAEPVSVAVVEPLPVIPGAACGDVTLAQIRQGETAIVVWVESATEPLGERLCARGLAPGTAVTVLRAGDPLVVAVGSSRWGIARLDAARISVARIAVGGGR